MTIAYIGRYSLNEIWEIKDYRNIKEEYSLQHSDK